MVNDCNRVDSARACQYWQRLLGLLEELKLRPKKKQNTTTRSQGLKKKGFRRRDLRKHMIINENTETCLQN